MTAEAKALLEGIELIARMGVDRLGTVCHGHDVERDCSVAVRFVHVGATAPDAERLARDLTARIASSGSSALVAPSRLELIDRPSEVDEPDPHDHAVVPVAISPFFARGSLRSRPPLDWPFEDLLRWLRPVAADLDALHADGFVHGDIRAERVLWSRSDAATLVDTGVARLVTDLDRHESDPYLAPEAKPGHPIDAGIDRYAFATTLAVSLSRLGSLSSDHNAALARARHADLGERSGSCVQLITELEQATLSAKSQASGQQAPPPTQADQAPTQADQAPTQANQAPPHTDQPPPGAGAGGTP